MILMQITTQIMFDILLYEDLTVPPIINITTNNHNHVIKPPTSHYASNVYIHTILELKAMIWPCYDQERES